MLLFTSIILLFCFHFTLIHTHDGVTNLDTTISNEFNDVDNLISITISEYLKANKNLEIASKEIEEHIKAITKGVSWTVVIGNFSIVYRAKAYCYFNYDGQKFLMFYN